MSDSDVHDDDVDVDVDRDAEPTGPSDALAFWGEELDEPVGEAIDGGDDVDEPTSSRRRSTGADDDRGSRRRRRKEWRREDKARRYAARKSVRFPVFTRSVLLWMLLFALVGVAFGASGAFWWAHFNTQVAELREETRDIDARSAEAVAQIEAERNRTLTEIEGALQPLQGFLSETRTIQLAQLFAPSVWFVATLDAEGRPLVGSAFSVVTGPDETLMVTSYTTVAASTLAPGPDILVRNGPDELRAELVNVDPDRDLALVRVPKGDIPVLEWAADTEQARALGSRVFPVSGLGGAGASLTSGIIIDQSFVGFLATPPVGEFTQGGPVVTADGKVLGVASLSYRPLGFDPGEVHFFPYVNTVCETLLDCGGGIERAEGLPQPPG
jgi:hypothetical protein